MSRSTDSGDSRKVKPWKTHQIFKENIRDQIMKKLLVLLVLVLLVLGVSGCTQSSPGVAVPKATAAVTKPSVTPAKTIPTPTPISYPSTVSTPSVSDNTIYIKHEGFDPQVITVKAGATVRWQNIDNSVHRLSFVDGYVTQTLAEDQSASKVFNNPGVFDYTDMMTPSLRGTVNVE
jgi:plastocyanin